MLYPQVALGPQLAGSPTQLHVVHVPNQGALHLLAHELGRLLEVARPAGRAGLPDHQGPLEQCLHPLRPAELGPDQGIEKTGPALHQVRVSILAGEALGRGLLFVTGAAV